jgi:hypothetical protein
MLILVKLLEKNNELVAENNELIAKNNQLVGENKQLNELIENVKN